MHKGTHQEISIFMKQLIIKQDEPGIISIAFKLNSCKR